MGSPEDESPAPAIAVKKPRRKRKTKAEKEAEAAAEAAKPLGARLWFICGAMLLLVGLCAFLDPGTILEGTRGTEGSWLLLIFQVVILALGKHVLAAILGIGGLLSLGWGLRVWLQQRSGQV